MQVTIQSLHFDAAEQLKDFVNHKVGKLERFYEGIISADVVLSLDKAGNTENKVTKITLTVPNDTLVAERQCKTFEEGVDLACDVLRRQISKYKEQK